MSSAKAVATPEEKRRHREVLEALSGLMMGMFVAILAGTVVSTSLPRIIADRYGRASASMCRAISSGSSMVVQ